MVIGIGIGIGISYSKFGGDSVGETGELFLTQMELLVMGMRNVAITDHDLVGQVGMARPLGIVAANSIIARGSNEVAGRSKVNSPPMGSAARRRTRSLATVRQLYLKPVPTPVTSAHIIFGIMDRRSIIFEAVDYHCMVCVRRRIMFITITSEAEVSQVPPHPGRN